MGLSLDLCFELILLSSLLSGTALRSESNTTCDTRGERGSVCLHVCEFKRPFIPCIFKLDLDESKPNSGNMVRDDSLLSGPNFEKSGVNHDQNQNSRK